MTIIALNTVKHNHRPSNQTYLDNRGNKCTSKRLKKPYSSRLASKHRTKTKLIDLLSELGETDLADRLKLCSSKFSAITCGSHIISRRPNHHCDFRLCPFCAVRRSRRLINKYLPVATAFSSSQRVTPVHLVLTQVSRVNEPLIGARERLLESFKKLSRRKFFEDHFAGGMAAVEVTIGIDGACHCHLHILGFRRRFFNVEDLRSEWLSVTGDSHVLRLDRVDDLQTGLREVLKYISKPLDVHSFARDHIRQFLQIKGARMFRAFGTFAKFCRTYEPSDNEIDGPVERFEFCAGDCCPICEAPLFELTLTVKELVGYARRIEFVPRNEVVARGGPVY